MSEQLLARAVVALEKIAAALELATTPVVDVAPAGCPHPSEQRVDFSAGPIEEWECRKCGFRYVGQPAEVIGG